MFSVHPLPTASEAPVMFVSPQERVLRQGSFQLHKCISGPAVLGGEVRRWLLSQHGILSYPTSLDGKSKSKSEGRLCDSILDRRSVCVAVRVHLGAGMGQGAQGLLVAPFLCIFLIHTYFSLHKIL